MSGPQLAAQVTAKYAGVKLLYMAGTLEEADVQGLGAAGGAVVQKPIPPALLARKVREILNS
jgi:DNA-binding response OmpR family regulator